MRLETQYTGIQLLAMLLILMLLERFHIRLLLTVQDFIFSITFLHEIFKFKFRIFLHDRFQVMMLMEQELHLLQTIVFHMRETLLGILPE